MSEVKVRGAVKKAVENGRTRLTVNVANPNRGVALMIRLKVVDPETEQLVAPIYYSENYFSLTEGEQREITIEYKAIAAGQEKVMLEGWNVSAQELASA